MSDTDSGRMHRKTIILEGVTHGPGRPVGSQVGNVVYSAGLPSRKASSKQFAEDPAQQLSDLFETIVAFLDAAGASLDDVIRVNIVLADQAHREELNTQWLKHFTDETSLPTRKVTIGVVPGAGIAEAELVAVLP